MIESFIYAIDWSELDQRRDGGEKATAFGEARDMRVWEAEEKNKPLEKMMLKARWLSHQALIDKHGSQIAYVQL